MSSNKIVFLEQSKIPTHYYNILADMPEPMEPPLHPQQNNQPDLKIYRQFFHGIN
jgi:predicted alternative tryptophan synthase beta-subunit